VRLSTSIVVTMLLCAGIRGAHAQLAGALDIGGGLGQSAHGVWMRQSVLAPSLRVFDRHGYLHLDAELIERGGELSLRRQRAEWAASTTSFGVFRLTVAADYAHDLLAPPLSRTAFGVTSALSAKWGANGLRTTFTRGAGSELRFDVGAWRVLGNAIFSLTSASRFVGVRGPASSRFVTFPDSVFNDTIGEWSHYQRRQTVRDSGSVARLLRWSDLEGRVDWSMGRVTLSAAMSGRGAVDSTPVTLWGRVAATMQINPRVSLTAGAGTVPALRPAPSAQRLSRFATLGIRLSPAVILRRPLPHGVRTSASAFVVRQSSPGSYLLTVRAPSARTVEVSGDFTGWSPVALRETAPDVWEVTVPLTPGTHRVNLRVDGDSWTAPPGLPTVDDEFNGRVGLLVIR
jgi:hypothetical protein